MKKYYGEEFINKIYRDLFESDIVKRSGKGANKNEDVSLYFDRLERISRKAIDHDKCDKVKRYYYSKYVISPENIPNSYFKKQEQLALDRGYGHVTYDEETKNKEKEVIIKEQKESLDSWLDYFASSDTDHYPTWFKYFCFQGMIRIGYFDKERNQYTKRTKNTIKPFIEINREAIAMLYDFMIKHLNKEKLDDETLKQLINNGNFSKIYAYCITKLDSVKKNINKSDEGKWIKYNQGSDPKILFNDIHGKGTGWCTAGGLETAKTHINGGDFYVYYTKDEKGKYTNPRIAIRMEDNSIAEIRGIAENQNLESNMERVVEEKLKEFPDGETYKKKIKDMEMLTYIYTKWKQGTELAKEDLRFLYEIDSEIVGFGYQKDPRIVEIIITRNKRNDLSKVLECNPDQISFTKKEALKGNIIYHYGNLALYKIKSIKNLTLPKIIGGFLVLSGLTSSEGLILPESISGSLNLSGLTNAKDLIFPKIIRGSLYLDKLTSSKGLVLPENIGGSLDLRSLSRAEGLTLPRNIGRNLNLSRLTSFEGLTLPQNIGGFLELNNLTSAKGITIPDTLDCYLSCSLANDDIDELKEMCNKNTKKR